MTDSGRFFIVGSGRCGSTLLRLCLSAHSRLYVTPETWFILDLVKRLPLGTTLSPVQVEEAIEIITSDYRWPDMEIDRADLKQGAARVATPQLRDVIDLVYDRLLVRSGKARLGDKTPPYVAIVPQLAALYPGAKFIHLFRDGRDVAISYIETMGYGSRFYDGPRFEWLAAMETALSYRGTTYADQILEVKYEDFVARPESTLRHICEFLGESYEPQMLADRPLLEAVPPRERCIHPNLQRPISEARVAIWRDRLFAYECFCMEACLRTPLEEYGYALRFAHPIWRPVLSATGRVLRAAAPLLDRAIPYLGRRNLLPRHFYF